MDAVMFAIIGTLAFLAAVFVAYWVGHSSGYEEGIALGKQIERNRIRAGIEEW